MSINKVTEIEPKDDEFTPQQYSDLAVAGFLKMDFSSVETVNKSRIMLSKVADLGTSLDENVAANLKGINKGLASIDAVSAKLSKQADTIDAAAAAAATNAANAAPGGSGVSVKVPSIPKFNFRAASDALKTGTRDIRAGIQNMMNNIELYVTGMSNIINGMMAVQESLQKRLDEIDEANIILVQAIYDCKDDTIEFLTKLSLALEKMLSDFAQCNVDAYKLMDEVNDNRLISLSLASDNIAIIHSRIQYNVTRVRHAAHYTSDYNATEYRALVSKMKQEQGSMANFVFSYFPQAVKGSGNIYFGGIIKYIQRKNIDGIDFETTDPDKMLENQAYLDSLDKDSKTHLAEILKSSSLHALIGVVVGRYIKKKRRSAANFFESITN